jgi:hypothetical protein
MIWDILSTILKVIYWLAVSIVVVMIILRFNLIPASIMKMLKNLKEKNKITKILYYFIVSLPCLLTELLLNLFSAGKNSPECVNYLLLLLFLFLAVILLIPCIIRYFYVRTPWVLSQLSKSTYEKKINAAIDGIEALETRVRQKRMMTPGVNWNANWLFTAENEVEKNEMRKELIRIGYRNKKDKEPFSKKILKASQDLARAYVQPGIPFYPSFRLRKQLNETFLAPKPPLENTLKFINANLEEMRDDLKRIPKMRFDYDKLKRGYKEYVATFKTKQLINDPIYTDSLTTSDNWHFENLKDGKVYNYNYSISAWIYIHDQGLNRGPYYNNFASIFNYGDKPNILYNMKKQTLRIQMRNRLRKNRILFETDELPMQKWNNIIINYDGGTLDIYINNKLVATEKSVIPYLSQDKITMGQEKGLSGGICNVIYYPEVLSPLKMTLFYETLKRFNPPILPNCVFS